MITSRFTAIHLEGERIHAWIELSNNKTEDNLFLPDATANDISSWAKSREDYYNGLLLKVEDLSSALIGDYIPWDFDYPLRISMSFMDWIRLVIDVPEMSQLVNMFKDSMTEHGLRHYIYLNEIYPEHEYILSQYESYRREWKS